MSQPEKIKIRLQSLDALRGLAILMMVLCGTIPFDGALPGWMYHAQLPPPEHVFLPDFPGITWVDLVFPFFLFSMGAAIPFSIGSKIEKGISNIVIGKDLLLRFGGLTLFAILSQHARPWGMNSDLWTKWMFAIIAFIGLIMIFAAPAKGWWSRNRKIVIITGVLIIVFLFLVLHLSKIVIFNILNFDIIIMILANTAFAGGLLYLLYNRFDNAIWIAFALVSAFFLSARDGNNWVTPIYYWSPISWLFSCDYIKYLIVIIPGIYTGQTIRKSIQAINDRESMSNSRFPVCLIIFSCVSLVLVSIVGLYIREMAWSFLISILLSGVLVYSVIIWNSIWKGILLKLLPLAIVLIITGYFLEPLNGGIKKDPATLSYMVLTSGLAMVTLFSFILIIDILKINKATSLLTGAGKNAMLAYIVGSNLIIPLFKLTGIDNLFNQESCFVTAQTIRAVVITIMVAWFSGIAARKGLFMKV